MVEEAADDPLGALVDAIERARSLLRRLGPMVKQLDVSADVYDEMVRRAYPRERFLTGGLPTALAADVYVHYDYPPQTWGVTYSDGTTESWSA